MAEIALFPMFAAAALCLLCPVLIALWWRKHSHCKLLTILIGAFTFLLFSQGLEGGLHYLCLVMDNPVSRAINGSSLLYATYGAFAAGIFEESGRYLAFRTVLKKRTAPETAISYGIGHGGIEMMLVGSASFGLYLAVYFLYQSGGEAALLPLAGSAEMVPALLAQVSQFTTGFCLLALFERFIALAFHIAASVFVFIAARDQEKRYYFPLAILLHAALDFPVALYQRGHLPLWSVELYAAMFTLAVCLGAKKLYRKLPEC